MQENLESSVITSTIPTEAVGTYNPATEVEASIRVIEGYPVQDGVHNGLSSNQNLSRQSHDEYFNDVREYLSKLAEGELLLMYMEGDKEIHELFAYFASASGINPEIDNVLLGVLRSAHGGIDKWRELAIEDSSITSIYLNQPHFAETIVNAANIEYLNNGGLFFSSELPQVPPESLGYANRTYLKRAKEAAFVAFGSEEPKDTEEVKNKLEIIDAVFGVDGDFADFAFEKRWAAGDKFDSSALGYMANSLLNYIHNIQHIGKEGAFLLYEKLGIVNFQRYDQLVLENALKFINCEPEFTEDLRENGISLLLSGQNGDFNGFTMLAWTGQATINSVPMEVSSPEDLGQLIDLLETAGLDNINNITILGHGDLVGLHISRNCLITRNLSGDSAQESVTNSPLGILLYKLSESRGSLNLASCFQAKQFDGRSSLADQIANTYVGLRVVGSDEVLYVFSDDSFEQYKPIKPGYAVFAKIRKLLKGYEPHAILVEAYPASDGSGRPLLIRRKIREPVRIS